ncbi:MAG: hypothetical protein EA352_10980 [Gemmatimonadales bacterium]|nr:MAG: hypothetical protein EA352_10980 [Gemmatimonadales bacterium]
MRPLLHALLLVLLLWGASACAEDGSPTARVSDFAAVSGVVFVDLDRDGQQRADDPALPGAQVSVGFRGGIPDLRTVVTDGEGRFLAGDLPPGELVLQVAGAALGDSLVLAGQEPRPLLLSVPDTVQAAVAVSFPIRTVPEALGTSTGSRIFVEGRALAGSGALPSGQVHLSGSGGVPLRTLVPSQPSFAAGDSIRVLGRVAQTPFGPRLEEGRQEVLGTGSSPTPLAVTTGEARSALGGDQRGGLVRVEATVLQASVSEGVAGVRMDDGSGPVDARIPVGHLGEAGLPVPPAGSSIRVTGVLLPSSSTASGWTLRTRGGADVSPVGLGTLEGRVFLDASGSGDWDPGAGDQPAVEALVRVRPDGVPGADSREVLTDSEGRFRLEDLPAGDWEVRVDPLTIPSGWGDETTTPQPAPVLPSGSVTVQIRFGMAAP